MYRLYIAGIIIFLVFFFVTYLLQRFFSTKRFVKYLPSLISLIGAIIYIVLAKGSQQEGFKDLAYVLVAVLLFIGFISGLISSLYFDYASKRKNI